MFNPFEREDPDLDAAIGAAFANLEKHNAADDEYRKTVEQIVKLYDLRPKRVDPNTLLTVVGNIFIGLAVIKYEQTGVIQSKVMSFMKKI